MQRHHGVDDPLDALPRPQQAPGQQCRPAVASACRGCRRHVGPMGDRRHLACVDVEDATQALACRLRHDHHLIGHRGDRLQHRTLVWGRNIEHRMGDHDGWHAQSAEDVEDVVPVRTAVDAVFVLHDRDVTGIQQLRGRRCRGGRLAREFTNHPGARGRRPVGDPDDGDVGAVHRQSVGQRRTEGGQPTAGRREGAQDAKAR